MAVLFKTLIEGAQEALRDQTETYWEFTTIAEWLTHGIRDYSNYFRRVKTQDITTSAADHQYNLSEDFLGVVSVEYPQGEDPPLYLVRRTRFLGNFWDAVGYYDLIEKFDGDTETNPAEIVISQSPAASETIRVHYEALHNTALQPGDNVTVPEQHHNILISFCKWRAWDELTSKQMANPTSDSSLQMALLGQNAKLAKQVYDGQIRQALERISVPGRAIVWDPIGRIY